MPIVTIQDAIDRAQKRHPSITTADALDFATEVYRELLQKADVGRSTVTVNVVAGTHTYSVPAHVYGIISADFRISATETVTLQHVSLDQAAERVHDFFSNPSGGTPCWISSVMASSTGIVSQFRLFPTPDTTTASGYPIVSLHVTREPSSITVLTPIPDRLPNGDVFVEGIWYKHAQIYRDQDAPALEIRYREAMEDAIASLRGMFRNEATQCLPRFLTNWPRQS